jgi:hypothetical protein
MQYDNTNRGAIWKNENRRPDKNDPHFQGVINIDGVDCQLSGWLPDPERKGPKTPDMTFSVRKSEPRTEPKPIERTIETVQDVNDEIPW